MTFLLHGLGLERPVTRESFGRFAWATLVFNLCVIVWGAFVRATGSGAGCGSHWPLCNGEVVPTPKSVATVIEMTHRLTSGLALLAVVALFFMARAFAERGHRIRKATGFALAFMISEALVGAGLVLFKLVEHDASTLRAFSIIVHLANTFFLLTALSLSAWWARFDEARARAPVSATTRRLTRVLCVSSMFAVLLLGATGAIAALGDHLFPSADLVSGIKQDFSKTAHLFVKLRVVHPVLALGATLLVVSGGAVARRAFTDPMTQRLASGVIGLFLVQSTLGLLNVVLLAPVGLQLVHLLVADALWIALTLLTAEVVAVSH